MENILAKEKNKIDRIFIKGISGIGVIAGLSDSFLWMNVTEGGFPVLSCLSIFVSYIFWIILLIYSIKNKNMAGEKPRYVRWYMDFILPFFHILFVTIGLIIGNLIINVFIK